MEKKFLIKETATLGDSKKLPSEPHGFCKKKKRLERKSAATGFPQKKKKKKKKKQYKMV